MTDIIAFTPILSTAIGIVTDRSEVAAAALQYILLSPGRTSDTHEDLLVSFRGLASRYGHDRDLICTELQKSVPVVLARSFPDDEIRCTFTASDYNGDPDDSRFSVAFDIIFNKADGTIEPAVISGTFTVGSQYEINVTFM